MRIVDGAPAFNATHIASALATTTMKSGQGILHTITINTKGTAANTLTVFDNTAGSGTVIAIIDTTSNVQTLILDVAFSTGLTVVSAVGTGADLTIAWA